MSARHGERGISLVEVLVALLLIAIGATAIVPVLVTSMQQNAGAADLSSLSASAAARMETLRATPFFQLTAGGSLTSNTAGYFDASDPDMVVRWEINNGGYPSGTKIIRVTAIAQRQVFGEIKSVQLSTLRAR